MKPQTYWRWSFLVKALLLTFIFPVLASLPFALLFYKNHDIANFVIAIGFYILIVPSLLTTIIATIFALAMRLYRKRTSTFIVSSIGIYASVIYGIFIFGKSYSQTNRDLIFIIICFALNHKVYAIFSPYSFFLFLSRKLFPCFSSLEWEVVVVIFLFILWQNIILWVQYHQY